MESKITKELRRIAAQHKGVLYPRDVVESARSEASPLHDSFEWNDAVAGENWRMEQARKLIRVAVTMIDGTTEPVRAFVSLTPNRADAGGYMEMERVLSQKRLREQMLRDATTELRLFTAKFKAIQELSKVNAAASEFLAEQEDA